MILVIPFCAKDWTLAERSLAWMKELDGHLPFHCVLSYDNETPQGAVQRCETIARGLFKEVTLFWYPAPVKKYWPAAPNCAWQNACRYIAQAHKDSWLFLEPDAIPIRKGWLTELDIEYRKAGKPFMGTIVCDMEHFNGAAVYPNVVAQYAIDPLMVEEVAWDVVIGKVLDAAAPNNPFVHNVPHLIQHCWLMDHENGKASNGVGDMPTFRDTHDIVKWVNLSACFFHRCKDGTIIDQLRRHYEEPHLAMVPNHVAVPDPVACPVPDNVVQLPKAEIVSMEQPKLATNGTPKVEIFIVTYGLPTKRVTGLVVSDFDWLTFCLRSIRRHCTGFTGITLAIPDRDAQLLKPIAAEHGASKCGIPLRIKLFHEKPMKGMLHHMGAIGHADEFVPKDTEFVMHVDADICFHTPTTPNDYFENGKPVYLIRTWDSLVGPDPKNPAAKIVSDCAQWRNPTEAQLGFETPWYTMCRIGGVFPISFYAKYREHIQQVHGKPFLDYMLSGKNDFPQNRQDWCAMGAFAKAKHENEFRFIDIEKEGAPKDHWVARWSHGGLTDGIIKETEGFLA